MVAAVTAIVAVVSKVEIDSPRVARTAGIRRGRPEKRVYSIRKINRINTRVSTRIIHNTAQRFTIRQPPIFTSP